VQPDMSRINPRFNVALFAFNAALGLFQFLVASANAWGISAGGLLATTLLDLARYAVVLLITAAFLAAFWRRLICSLAPIRPIDYQEAIAVVLMIGVLFNRCARLGTEADPLDRIGPKGFSPWSAVPAVAQSAESRQRWTRKAPRASVQAASSTNPARRARCASRAGVYLCELSVWIVSPRAKRTDRSASGMVTT